MDVDLTTCADDFFVNLNVQTVLGMPTGRETVLSFFEAVQKEYPSMTNFYHRESGEFVLEAEHDSGSYQWLEVQPHRMCSGFFNPPASAEARRQHRWVLERSRYYLGLSGLDVECVDVVFGFNLDYHGNRDAVVAQALLGNSPLAALLVEPGGRPLECEPSLVIALNESCCLQARLSLETRSNSYQVRTGMYEDEPITVYLTVRQYPPPRGILQPDQSFDAQFEACEDLAARLIVPNVIQPIAAAIAGSR